MHSGDLNSIAQQWCQSMEVITTTEFKASQIDGKEQRINELEKQVQAMEK